MALMSPSRVYSFENFSKTNPRGQTPGDRLDAQFHDHHEAIRSTQESLRALQRSDGALANALITKDALSPTLVAELVGNVRAKTAPDADRAYAAAVAAKADAEIAARALREITGLAMQIQFNANRVTNGADSAVARALKAKAEIEQIAVKVEEDKLLTLRQQATIKAGAGESEAWAIASMQWAEHMPGTLPADTIANMDVTGDHWSARWWANQAGAAYGRLAEYYQGARTEPPTETASGDPLPPGALYYDLTTNTMMVWNGTDWLPIGGNPTKATTVTLDYKATAGQMNFPFSAPDLHGQTFFVSSSAPQPVEVFRAGARLTQDPGSGTIGQFTYTPRPTPSRSWARPPPSTRGSSSMSSGAPPIWRPVASSSMAPWTLISIPPPAIPAGRMAPEPHSSCAWPRMAPRSPPPRTPSLKST